jgi:hypothetical protein
MARVPLTSSLIADALLGPDRSLLQLAVPRPADRRNRPRLSLLEPLHEGGWSDGQHPGAGVRSAPTQAEWAVVALEATWTRPRGFVAL